LDWIYEEIEKCLDLNLLYAALLLAFAIPDICAKLSEELGMPIEKYSRWFDKYVKQFFNIVDGNACWQTRLVKYRPSGFPPYKIGAPVVG
jgi:hypothetical protein